MASKEVVKKQETGIIKRDDIQWAENSNSVTGMASLLKQAKEVDSSELDELTSDYQSLYVGKHYAFLFTGMGTFSTDQGEVRDCANLVNEEGTMVINGEAIMVSTARKLVKMVADGKCTLPIPIKVEVGEEVKSANGKYKSMRIFRY